MSRPARRPRSKELQAAADAAAIAAAPEFTVVRFLGRRPGDGAVARENLYDVRRFAAAAYGGSAVALAEARRVAAAIGADEFGRRPLVYAVTATGATIHVG